MRIWVLLAWLWFGAAMQPLYCQTQLEMPIVSVCEILSQPLNYDGRLITIRSRIEGTTEGTWFVDDSCPGIFATEGHAWPSEIALAMPGLPSQLQLHTIDFKFDFESERRVQSMSRRLRRRYPPSCLLYTYTGLFETRRDWSRAKLSYADGTSKLAGFGHLGEAPGQLILKSAVHVVVNAKCAEPHRVK
jgi:hypothetical protein